MMRQLHRHPMAAEEEVCTKHTGWWWQTFKIVTSLISYRTDIQRLNRFETHVINYAAVFLHMRTHNHDGDGGVL